MLAKQPSIPQRTHMRRRQFWDVVGVGQTNGLVGGQLRKFYRGEANEAHIELHGSKIGQLEGQHCIVPPGVQRQLVVGKD
jgi:hypothetical protein